MRIEDMTEDEESMEELKSLKISSLDDEDEGLKTDDYINELNEEEDDDEEEEEDDEEEEVLVTLGFAEKPENNWCLQRQVFPSKAGGIPAWLDPENLPSGKSCLCDICGEPLQFLIQVYAPISEKNSSFHRTLFVFMCPSMTCLLRDQHEQWKHGPEIPSRSVKVFRCQLPRSNAFYSSDSPRYDGSDMPLGIGEHGREIKFVAAVKHWREGHKLECRNLSAQLPDANKIDSGACSNEILKVPSKTLWSEYNIIVDDESELSMSDVDEHSNSLITTQERDGIAKSTLETFEGDDDRKSWAAFQERLARAPEQVLRYSRDERAQPLWPTSSGRPSKADIPKCSYCRGAMTFEFQVLPQLLYYFEVKNEVDSLDWATIAVYTCVDSCEGSAAYKEELAWVQLNSQTS
ncbi:hypothetical protein KSS87_004832 [Heliosperma pusillum]|nr:hypothetical protein KSS87_004832 [Heliosperma pusillum]